MQAFLYKEQDVLNLLGIVLEHCFLIMTTLCEHQLPEFPSQILGVEVNVS